MTLDPVPGALCTETCRGVPNSHIITEPSNDPVKSGEGEGEGEGEGGGRGEGEELGWFSCSLKK